MIYLVIHISIILKLVIFAPTASFLVIGLNNRLLTIRDATTGTPVGFNRRRAARTSVAGVEVYHLDLLDAVLFTKFTHRCLFLFARQFHVLTLLGFESLCLASLWLLFDEKLESV